MEGKTDKVTLPNSIQIEMLVSLLSSQAIEICPKCGVHNPILVKGGKTSKGLQMYRCTTCNHRFTEGHGGLTFNSHQPEEVWKIFIRQMLEGHSLRYIAAYHSLDLSTVFRMKHKLLNFIEKDFTTYTK